MPIFEFRCQQCEHLEEVLQKYTDPPPDPCPACGAEGAMQKEVSLTSFQLKGGGWYKDLYSSTPSKDKGGGDKKDAGATKDASSSSKSDAKSDAKAKKGNGGGAKASKAA